MLPSTFTYFCRMSVLSKLSQRLFILMLVLSPILVSAQKYSHKKTILNLREFDEKKLHFGFILGINSGDFALQYDLSENDSLIGLYTQKQPGFNIGTVTDYHLHPELSIRFLFTLSFAQRDLIYSYRMASNSTQRRTVTKSIESTYLDFPLNFKYRSLRYNNFAAYIIGGARYSLDLASKEGSSRSSSATAVAMNLRRPTIAYDVGVGCYFLL